MARTQHAPRLTRKLLCVCSVAVVARGATLDPLRGVLAVAWILFPSLLVLML
jgi:hypothetical protein